MTLVPIFETTELTIYGGPDTISIISDLGPKGDRGSLIFTNFSSPDTYTSYNNGEYQISSITLRARDMYYRVENDTWYQWLNNEWQQRSGLKKFFKIKENITFVSGIGTATIPISSLWGDTDIANITSSNILITLSPVDSSPTFVTITNKYLDELVPQSLIIEIAGYNFSLGSSSLTLLNSTISIDMIISLV